MFGRSMATSLSTPPSTPLSMTQIWNAYVLCSEYRGVIKKSHKSREELVYYPKSHVFAFRNKLFLGYSSEECESYVQVSVPTDGPTYDNAWMKADLMLPPYHSIFDINRDHYYLSLSVNQGRSSLLDLSPSMSYDIPSHYTSTYGF